MEGVAAATTFIYIKKWKHTHWKWFPLYLAFIVCADVVGSYLAARNMYKPNFYFLSYVVIPVEFLFFYWIFYRAFRGSSKQSLPVIMGTIYFIGLLADIFYFSHYQFFYYSLSYTIGNIMLLILILNFFLQLVNSDELLKFKQNILFWVSVGLLIYYVGSCPYFALRNLLVYKYYNTVFQYYTAFVDILGSLMYLTFALSFICGKPK